MAATIILAIIVFLAGFALGFAFGYVLGRRPTRAEMLTLDRYMEQLERIQQEERRL